MISYNCFYLLGPLYTRSQGQCLPQIQHSYWCKSWNEPQGLQTRSQGWNRKKLFNLPQVLINAELYGFLLVPRLKKVYHQIWEANLQPKNAQRWPQVFLAMISSVKRTLVFYCNYHNQLSPIFGIMNSVNSMFD